METKEKCLCPQCQKRMEEEQKTDDQSMAILIAMVPILTIALFGNMGIF